MCEHERLRTVGNRVFCCGCGAELSIEFLLAKNDQKQGKKPATEAKTDKPTAKKRTAKKAE